MDTKISLNSEIPFDFYLYSPEKEVPRDYICRLTVYNGARKPSKFRDGVIISPNHTNTNSDGWFSCSSRVYTAKVPENLTCELCTFEWSYKKIGTEKFNSLCVDTWANSVWHPEDHVNIPRLNMRFEKRS